jgi:hypothetical protein
MLWSFLAQYGGGGGGNGGGGGGGGFSATYWIVVAIIAVVVITGIGRPDTATTDVSRSCRPEPPSSR